MHTFKLGSFPIEQISDLHSFEWRLGQWYAARNYPVRQIAVSRRFDMQPPITRLQKTQQHMTRLARQAEPLLAAIDAWFEDQPANPLDILAAYDADERAWLSSVLPRRKDLQAFLEAAFNGQIDNPDTTKDHWVTIAEQLTMAIWPLPWQKEMIRFYQALEERHLRSIEHYMLTWEPADMSAQAVQTQLRHAFARDVEISEGMPSILGCTYTEQATRLVPLQPGYPYYAVLHSYEVRGEWNATTLHPLLEGNFDLSVVVDVDTLPRNKAMRVAETAHAAAKLVQRDDTLIDTRAARVLHDSERVMHELSVQSLHLVTIAVLVSSETEQALEDNVAEIMSRLGTTLRLTRVAGAQGELIKLWSPTPTKRLDLPTKPWNMLSHGVGCCAGIIGYHRASSTKGLLWGLDAVRRAPLFHDPFGNNQAAHMCILGKTGYGKTWFLNQITMRATAIADWKVIGIDAFRNGERVEQAAGIGARCNWIGLESAVNILDVVYDKEEEGGWIGKQVQHVIGQLAMLLGEPGTNAHGEEELLPRRFSIAERGLLDQALSALYAEVDPDGLPHEMPILSDFVAILEELGEEETDRLARDLRLFLSGSMAASFDAITTVDWDFASDINYFDFSNVPETLRAFYYGQAVGAINRYMRDGSRDRSRPTLLLIDEFHYVTKTEVVARMAAEIAKVARKYRLAVVPVDQNPTTFLDNKYGLFIWENSTGKVLFHLDDLPAQRVGEAIGDLTPEHVAFLSQAVAGQAIMMFNNDVYVTNVETNPKETRAFAGS